MKGNGSAERRLHVANGTTFMIPKRYNHLEVIGKGSYGMVCSAVDSVRNNAAVAIKKITPMAAHSVDAKHVLREVRVMRYLGEHENIVTLEDLFCNEQEDELYIVMELLDSDLHRIIQSNQVLSRKHHQVFMIQILRGVEFLHKNGIIHRDLKPGNILLTRNCQLRISDFGLARELPKDTESSAEARRDGDGMTEHVVTRWYRPPELMLSPNGFYGFPVDVWSVGCIFGELLGRRPLFPGSSFVDQLSLIFDVLGAPAQDEVAHIRGAQARKFLDRLKGRRGVSFSDLIPGTPTDAAALLKSLLLFDPLKRCTPGEALDHPFFEDLGEDTALKVAPPTGLEFDFEQKGVSRSRLKELIANEIDHFQAGGANLTLHSKTQQRHRHQHHATPRAIDRAEIGDAPITAVAAATAAAAAASSAPFSSDKEDGSDSQGDGSSGSNPESDRCYSSDSTEHNAADAPQKRSPLPDSDDDDDDDGGVPDDIDADADVDDVACLDAASLQSSRLCPREGATEDDSDEATSDDGGGGYYDSEATSRRAGLVAVVVSASTGGCGEDDDRDDATAGSTLSRASSLSPSSSPSPSPENDGRAGGGRAALAKRSDGAPVAVRRTFWENKLVEKNEARGRQGTAMQATSTGEATAKAAGTANRSPVRAAGTAAHDMDDFSPIPAEEEEGQDSSPPCGTGRDYGGGGAEAEAASAGEVKSVAFRPFDSCAETSLDEEASGSSQGFATSPVSVPGKPTRETSVAGFVRGSDGWDSESDRDGDGASIIGGKLFVSLMSPSSSQQQNATLGAAPEASSGRVGNGGGGSKPGESDEAPAAGRGSNVFARASVRSGGGSGSSGKDRSRSSQASDILRRERAERAWQVVGEARAKVKARADAAAALTSAAGTTGPGQARDGLRARHPAVVAARRRTAAAAAAAAAAGAGARERRAKLLHDVRRRGAGKGMAAAKAEKSPFSPPRGGTMMASTRRAPISGSTLFLESQDSSWLRRREGGHGGGTVKSVSTNGSSDKQAPLEFRPTPPEKGGGDPFCDFFSGQTSLVTHEDPFCDYVSGKTTISAGGGVATAATAVPAHAAAPTSPAPPAPAAPSSGGCRLPVMEAGQKLKVRGAAALVTPNNRSDARQPLFGGGGAEKDSRRHHHPLRAPVASVQREHLNPLVVPANRFEYPMAGGGASSVASSRGSPPPVPPPLRQRRKHGGRCARAGTCGRSLVGGHLALPKTAADGVHASGADADAGAGRGHQRAGLPPPITTAARMKAKGWHGCAAQRGGRHLPTASAATAAEKPRSSVTSGEASAAASASQDTYYSVDDVVTLKLPDRFASPSPAGNKGTACMSDQEHGGVDGPLSPIPHNRLTARPCDKPRSIPPIQAWKWEGGRTVQTAPAVPAPAGARKGGDGGSSEQQRPTTTAVTMTTTAALPRQQPLSPISGESPAAVLAMRDSVSAASGAGTTVADDGDDGSPALTTTTTTTTVTTTTTISTTGTASGSAAAGGKDKPGSACENKSFASAMYAANNRERGAARTKKKNHRHPHPNQAQLPQLDKPWGYPLGDPLGAGRTRPPRAAAACRFNEQSKNDKDRGGGGGGGGDGTSDLATSAEQKFTLLKRLWKRSNAGRSMGKQGAISAATRHAPGATSFDAGPSPRGEGNNEQDGDGSEEEDEEDAPPGPVVVSQAAAAFPIPQKIAVKVLPSSPQQRQRQQQQQQKMEKRGAVATTAAAAILSAGKSHKRSASGATSLTCGTSPASSATSGFREGSQQLLVPHAAGSGLSPARLGRSSTAGSGFGSGSVRTGPHPASTAAAAVAAEATSSSRLRSGGRQRRDNIIRAVQFAGEMPALRVGFSASTQNRGGGDARTGGVGGGLEGYPREFKNRPFQTSGMAAAVGGQKCGIRDNICRGGGGGGDGDGGRQLKVYPAPPSPSASAAKPPRHSSTVYP